MEQRTAKQIQEALAKPFAAGDLEWRLQKAYPQEMRGIAVPYVTNRAIQYRLDDVVGVENWYNRFKPWHMWRLSWGATRSSCALAASTPSAAFGKRWRV